MVDEGRGVGVGVGVAVEVDEGRGVAEGTTEGTTEGVTDTAGVAEGVGVAVLAAESEGDGPINRNGRLKISPNGINFRRSTGHCYIIEALAAIRATCIKRIWIGSQKALMGRTELEIPLNRRY